MTMKPTAWLCVISFPNLMQFSTASRRTESWSSRANDSNAGKMSLNNNDEWTTFATAPIWAHAARRTYTDTRTVSTTVCVCVCVSAPTIGVASWHKDANRDLSFCLALLSEMASYVGTKRAHEDMRGVNHSPDAKRSTKGTMCSSNPSLGKQLLIRIIEAIACKKK